MISEISEISELEDLQNLSSLEYCWKNKTKLSRKLRLWYCCSSVTQLSSRENTISIYAWQILSSAPQQKKHVYAYTQNLLLISKSPSLCTKRKFRQPRFWPSLVSSLDHIFPSPTSHYTLPLSSPPTGRRFINFSPIPPAIGLKPRPRVPPRNVNTQIQYPIDPRVCVTSLPQWTKHRFNNPRLIDQLMKQKSCKVFVWWLRCSW